MTISLERSLEQAPAQLLSLGAVNDLRKAKRSVVAVDGRELLVLCVRKRFTVVENSCPHLGRPLDDARIVGRTIVCSSHGYKYSLADGAAIPGWRCSASGGGRLTLLPTVVEDGVLYIHA